VAKISKNVKNKFKRIFIGYGVDVSKTKHAYKGTFKAASSYLYNKYQE
jgi:hypothetical protein